jgi:hypothetical protein
MSKQQLSLETMKAKSEADKKIAGLEQVVLPCMPYIYLHLYEL